MKYIFGLICLFFVSTGYGQGNDLVTLYNADSTIITTGVVDQNKLRQGLWRFYNNSNQIIQEGYYKDSKKVDNWVTYNPRTGLKTYELQYVNDKPNGLYQQYDEMGNLSIKVVMKDSSLVGKYEEFHPNKKPKIIQ